MAEIKINILNLEEQTDQLIALSRSFGSRETVMPEISGSGPVASRTQELGQMLLRIRESLKELFDSTIVFLNSARSSYVESDTQLAHEYEE